METKVLTTTANSRTRTACRLDYIHRVSKKVVHQAHIDKLVNSQRIFKILSLTHSVENML